jgi:hypothetical protein
MPADEPDLVAFQDQPISQLLVKVAARCNIDCSYCYWFRDAAVHDKPKLMSAGVLHRLLRDGTIRVFSRLSVTPSVLKILLARVKACSASTRVRQVTTQSSAQRVSRHPPPIRTPPRGMLAHLLWRHPRRNNFRARRQSDQWEWNCGFYPGSESGQISSDTAAVFEEARADFEAAWQVFLSNRTEADFR